MLKIEDLRFQDIGPLNLEVAQGECVGITGASGIGKSLFLRAVADMDPHEGRVLLDGVDSGKIPPPEWRKRVGLLPAESAWWFDTVEPHISRNGWKGLERLGFPPDVFDWQIARLSSGERQRLSLIRMLANGPSVLLLDEPTANLDAESGARVEAFLGDYRNEKRPAILWVSHDISQIERAADRRFRLLKTGLEPL